ASRFVKALSTSSDSIADRSTKKFFSLHERSNVLRRQRAEVAKICLLEGGGGSKYESIFAAIHQRRLNWIPILQKQKYYSIVDVVLELRRVTTKKKNDRDEIETVKKSDEVKVSTTTIEVSQFRNRGGIDVRELGIGRGAAW
ncbi:hypothetical protein U1Q18_019562, partial [Sarracenia purpurea var. burkii]